MSENHENIFNKGCLVQLSISKWGANKKIDPAQLGYMAADKADWIKTNKSLIDKNELKEICKVSGKAKNWLISKSLPFPIRGLVFVSKEMISEIDQGLSNYAIEFTNAVQNFCSKYHDLRINAQYALGDLFSEFDYPINIESKFNMAWRFITIDTPNGNAGLLSPELYERERQKFINTMAEAQDLAIGYLRDEFLEMVKNAANNFANGKKFKNATVDNIYNFIESFKNRTIYDDNELEHFMAEVNKIFNNMSANEIRDNIKSDNDFKKAISSQLGNIAEQLEQSAAPKRKIVLDD